MLRALLLQALYTIRSERQLTEELDYSVRLSRRPVPVDGSRPLFRLEKLRIGVFNVANLGAVFVRDPRSESIGDAAPSRQRATHPARATTANRVTWIVTQPFREMAICRR